MFIRSPKELALLIVNQRKKLKLSQAEVSSLVGLKQKTISALENKPEGTQIGTLFRVLSALKLDMKMAEKDKIPMTKIGWKEEW